MQNHAFDQDKITRIKNLLQFHPKGLTISDISQKLKISRISIAKYLDILLVSGQVEMKTFGAAKAYFLSSRVPISAMLSFSSDYILSLDNNFRILQVNKKFLEFMQVKREDIVGRELTQTPFTFLKEVVNQSILARTEEETEFTTEISLKIEGDDMHHFKVKVVPTVFDDGSQGLTTILEDVTKQKRAEQMRSFLASIVESSDDAIIGKDLDGKIVSWNKAAEYVYGYTAEEIIGRPIELLIPDPYKEEFRSLMKRVQQGDSITHLETKRLNKEGTLMDVSLTISPIRDESGKIVAISTICRDITHIKSMQEEIRIKKKKLEEIIDFLPDPTFILDRNKNILGWNKAMEIFSGINRGDVLGKSCYPVLSPFIESGKPLLIDLICKPRMEIQEEYPNITKIGDTVSTEAYLPKRKMHVLVKALPIFDNNGSLIGAIESIKDISHWKIIQDGMRKSHERLKGELQEKIDHLDEENKRLNNELQRIQGDHDLVFLLRNSFQVLKKEILILNSLGHIRYVSDGMAQMLGHPDSTTLVGTSIEHWIDEASLCLLQECVKTGKDDPITVRWNPSKEEIPDPVRITVVPVLERDQVLGMIGIPEQS